MRTVLKVLLIGWLLVLAAWPQSDAGLERVLTQMDAAARNFKTTEASFVWDHYQKVIDETDTQKGRIYFRREGSETQMAADLVEPDRKYVIYSGGKVQVYQPKIDQVNEYSPGKNRSDVESFLVLGFGGSGHDLAANWDITDLGPEQMSDGSMTVTVEKLDLRSKDETVRNSYTHITIWVDLARDISLKQVGFTPSGDTDTTIYSNIRPIQPSDLKAFAIKCKGKCS